MSSVSDPKWNQHRSPGKLYISESKRIPSDPQALPNPTTHTIRSFITLRNSESMERYSRLKTRKILGVGESAEGLVPYSKISQLLGPFTYPHVEFPVPLLLWHSIKIIALLGFAFIRIYNDYWYPTEGVYERRPTYEPSLMIGLAVIHIQSWSSAEKLAMVICYTSTITTNLFAILEYVMFKGKSLIAVHIISTLLDIFCLRMLIDNRRRTTQSTD